MKRSDSPQRPNRHRLTGPGFTLAELLIALAILGVIATFTIPKVLQSQQDGRRVAVLKETVATWESLMYEAYQQNQIRRIAAGNYMLEQFLDQRLNYVAKCADMSCLPAGFTCPTSTAASNNYVLANGAILCGVAATPVLPRDDVAVDWNGGAEPNTVGQDRLILWSCFSGDDPSSCELFGQPVAAGKTVPYYHSGHTESRALYYEIFAP